MFVLDTFNERNALMERVYPKLKSYCQSVGYDFQVVDMRWGIRDEATDDHMTTELCMKELKACQDLSTGPNFIVSIVIFTIEVSDVIKTSFINCSSEKTKWVCTEAHN